MILSAAPSHCGSPRGIMGSLVAVSMARGIAGCPCGACGRPRRWQSHLPPLASCKATSVCVGVSMRKDVHVAEPLSPQAAS